MGKSVLVTGGHGFIGHHLVKKLLDNKHYVDVIDSHTTYGTLDHIKLVALLYQRLQHIGLHSYLVDDIRTTELQDKYDTVIHFAGFPRQYETSRFPDEACDILARGLVNLFTSLKSVKHFVFISTSMAYGDFSPYVSEDTVCAPKSQYGVMRLMGEKLVMEYCRRFKIKYTIIRPSAVYGPRDTDNRIVGKFFHQALQNKALTLKGPYLILDFTYVDDLVDGIYLTLENPESHNEIFNLTRSHASPNTIFDLANAIIRVTGSQSKFIIEDRDLAFPNRSTLSIRKARKLLGFNPRIDLEEGIERTYEWLRSHTRIPA